MVFLGVVGCVLMLATQATMSYIAWRRGNTFTVSGSRIIWSNARLRDFILVLRVIAAGIFASAAVPSFPDQNALAYMAGVVLGFILPSLSDLPVVLMKRWNIAPHSVGSSRRAGERGRKTTNTGRSRRDESEQKTRSRDV